jgi:hypothetical protein
MTFPQPHSRSTTSDTRSSFTRDDRFRDSCVNHDISTITESSFDEAQSDLFGDLQDKETSLQPGSQQPHHGPPIHRSASDLTEEEDAEISPKSRSSASLHRPSIPGPISHEDDHPPSIANMPTPFSDDYSPDKASASVPTVRTPSNAAEYSPTARKKSSIADLSSNKLYVSRPGLDRGSSERPLMDDISAANTPATGMHANPFDSANPSVNNSVDDIDRLASPKIHIIPFTPAESARAAFAEQEFLDDGPEAGPSSHSGSRSNSDPSTSSLHDYGVSRTSALEGNVTSISARRSQRMKQKEKPVSSKRESKRDTTKPAGAGLKRMPFQSTRLKGEIYKPWLEKKDPAQRWARWITIISIILGIGAAGASESLLC